MTVTLKRRAPTKKTTPRQGPAAKAAAAGRGVAARDPAKVEPPGVLLVLSDVLPEAEGDFNRWYEQEAIPARLALDGFVSARRYYAVGGTLAYMTLYNCRTIGTVTSKAYREHMASPSPWRVRVRKNFRNLQLSACRETWSEGTGMGGSVVVVQCSPLKGREADARRFLREQLAPRLRAQDGVVRMALWEADANITANMSVASREDLQSYTKWVLFLESYDLVRMALVLHTELLAQESAETGLLIGALMRYQLVSAHMR